MQNVIVSNIISFLSCRTLVILYVIFLSRLHLNFFLVHYLSFFSIYCVLFNIQLMNLKTNWSVSNFVIFFFVSASYCLLPLSFAEKERKLIDSIKKKMNFSFKDEERKKKNSFSLVFIYILTCLILEQKPHISLVCFVYKENTRKKVV